ncbi:MAG: NAD(P)H-binding protein, partial [Anaerolineales bacterium]
MILVTGGTGFVGQALIRQLVAQGKTVRTLLRPSQSSPNLPRGIPVEVAVSSLNDERSLRAALKGVDTVFHLAGSERNGSKADLTGVDIAGTRMLAQAAAQAKVERIFYLSHLGADRASAFALLKAKAIAEQFIIKSGINYTIFRSGPIYGPGDQFTTGLARLLRMSPGVFLMPGDGNTLLQPIWIEDLITCLLLSLGEPQTLNQIYSIGGAEYYRFREIVEILLQKLSIKRFLISIQPPYLRLIGLFMEQFMPRFPVSIFWLDYLAVDRTCALDVLPRLFGLMPMRFAQNLDYLTTIENVTR